VKRYNHAVDSNARLTAGLGGALLLLFAAEGLTLLSVRSLLTAHVVIGMVLIPPVLVKMGPRDGASFAITPDRQNIGRKGRPRCCSGSSGPRWSC
jgi:hypothetical protein